ncbi:hypothetical protein CJF32_00009360 [Rutstroemia sp. NJR-2017a WRK4]|nr:hypothetical protein CJF32_00009360 [Rutstroemia sp. NJR-2017a WRK4]
MGKIYKGAKKVLILLGLDDMDGDMLGRVTACALHLNRQVSLQVTVTFNI